MVRKANALLVAEGDDFNRVIETLAALGQSSTIASAASAPNFRRSVRRRARCRYASPASAPGRPHACPRSAPPRCLPRRSAASSPASPHQPMKACAAPPMRIRRKSRVRRRGSSLKAANASSLAISRRPAARSASNIFASISSAPSRRRASEPASSARHPSSG